MSEDNLSKELKKQIGQLLEEAREDFRMFETNKKVRLLKLAKDMEDTGYPKDMICATICKAISGEGISRDTIERTLPDEYKKKKIRNLTQSDDKKVLEVTTNGSPLWSKPKPESEPESEPERKLSPIETLAAVKADADPNKFVPEDPRIEERDRKIAKLEEQMIEQTNHFQKLMKAKQQQSPVTTEITDALRSEISILKQRNEELEQLVKKDPSLGFMNATQMQPKSNEITTITTTIPNEVEFPAKELITFRMDVNAAKPFWAEAKDAKKVMYLIIQGNQVVNWESDYTREKKKKA